jgi:crossover junction endodeoxyribonuclease RuvC
MASVRILGIDPGFDRLGVGCIDKDGSKETLVFSTCLVTNRKDSFEKRLLHLGDELSVLLERYRPNEVAMENLFFTTNQKTAIGVAEVRGVCLFLAAHNNLRVFEYSPPQVKVAVTGYGKATKDDVALMVPKLLKTSFPKKTLDDELDALAVALTHSAHRKTAIISELL